MKKCKNADKYKGVHPPRCNNGDPCDACKEKRNAVINHRSNPSERGKAFATELDNLAIGGGSYQDWINYVAGLFDAYAGKVGEELKKDPQFCDECGTIYYNCKCKEKHE